MKGCVDKRLMELAEGCAGRAGRRMERKVGEGRKEGGNEDDLIEL